MNIKNVLEFEGESLAISESLPSFELDGCVVSDISANGVVRNNAGRVEINLDIDSTATTACARCGDEVKTALKATVDEALDVEYVSGDNLKLYNLALQEISLALPLRFLCKPDCKGLCPDCGANLNIRQCVCGED